MRTSKSGQPAHGLPQEFLETYFSPEELPELINDLRKVEFLALYSTEGPLDREYLSGLMKLRLLIDGLQNVHFQRPFLTPNTYLS